MEVPSEIEIRNRTSQQIGYLKLKLIDELMDVVRSQNVSTDDIYDKFSMITVEGYCFKTIFLFIVYTNLSKVLCEKKMVKTEICMRLYI